LNGTRQPPFSVHYTNLLRYEINTGKNTESLAGARKEVALKVNAEKTKRVFRSHHQHAGHIHSKHYLAVLRKFIKLKIFESGSKK
jgi:hypothetical protein